jgi:hypothetical protein
VTEAPSWSIDAEYFENCNCDVVCPCEISALGFLQARPDQGHCDVFLMFHINTGKFGDVQIDDLNVMLAARAPGPMIEGNWTAAIYLDERASGEQQQALGAIFGGAAGGPMGALAPLIGTNLGAKLVPIEYRNEGRRRSAHISNILDVTIEAVPSYKEDAVVIKQNANPLFEGSDWVQASGVSSSYRDYDFEWDNTGKCADYASFRWAGP